MSGVIHLQTEIPGPKSRALLARRAKAVPRGVPAVTPIAVVHAEGAVITDADGNRLIDFGGGIGVVNTGHRHPGVVEAVREQLDHFAHVCFPVSTYEPYVALAERLNRITPGTHDKRTFFINSGAEAVENAVKVARSFTGRQAILCFEHGFHGRTTLAMGLTSKVLSDKGLEWVQLSAPALIAERSAALQRALTRLVDTPLETRLQEARSALRTRHSAPGPWLTPARQWLIVPDGALDYVPFAALRGRGDEADAFVVMHHDVAVTPAAWMLRRRRRTRHGRRAGCCWSPIRSIRRMIRGSPRRARWPPSQRCQSLRARGGAREYAAPAIHCGRGPGHRGTVSSGAGAGASGSMPRARECCRSTGRSTATSTWRHTASWMRRCRSCRRSFSGPTIRRARPPTASVRVVGSRAGIAECRRRRFQRLRHRSRQADTERGPDGPGHDYAGARCAGGRGFTLAGR